MEILQKTSVLNVPKERYLSFNRRKIQPIDVKKTQFLPSATATLLKNQERDYLVTKPKIQPSDVKKSRITQPLITSQKGNCEDSSQLEKINQLSFFDGFNCLDLVAVTGNNVLLSQKLSVSPLRHSGIFLPIVQQDGSAMPLCRVDTSKYKTLLGKYEGRLLTAESETRHPNASQALTVFLNQS